MGLSWRRKTPSAARSSSRRARSTRRQPWPGSAPCFCCRTGTWRSELSNGEDARAALDLVFRTRHRGLMAALTRRFGPAQLDLLENALQGAAVRALERWTLEGVPAQAEGWLLRVASNLVVDAHRRDRHQPELVSDSIDLADQNHAVEPDVPAIDDELCLVFLCCHPVLPRAAQVALTLKVGSGFTVQQIAAAFLSDERTIAQRLVRAKQRLREDGVRFELPDPDELPSRLEA